MRSSTRRRRSTPGSSNRGAELWLAHWEDLGGAAQWTRKRQVLAMFAEKPALKPLPATRFRYFRETSHTVKYPARVLLTLPASSGRIVTVRLYDHDLEIIDSAGQLLRRHTRSFTPGHFEMEDSDRICETVRLLESRQARSKQPATRSRIFLRLGRPGQKALTAYRTRAAMRRRTSRTPRSTCSA